jgi:PAS domain-containing protein
VIVDAFSLGGIAGGFHFVAFRDVPPSGAEPPAHSAADALEAQIAMARELLMESKQRLVAAKEELESVGHDLRCSNDRLRATNIDLMASREEARAFHQNLKERNELLFDHVRGFVCDGDDVANVLTALQNPFLLVDRDGRIRKVSRSAEQSFGLTTEDLGRPISLVADIVGAPALTEAVLKAITQGARSELGVERPTGCFYLVAVVPYDLSGTKGGALVEFIIDRP